MEQYYIKKDNGRYEKAGYSVPDLPEGFYFKQNVKGGGSRGTSISFWMGSNPPQPLDVNRLVEIMSKDEKLATYLGKLEEEDSDEFKKACEDSSSINGPLKVYNWSRMDLATCILRFMFEEMQKCPTK